MKNNMVQCAECGALIDEALAVLADDGGNYCPECAQEVLRECDHCGCVLRADDLSDVHVQYGHAGYEELWCSECVDDDTFYCVECGERYERRSNSHYTLPGGDWICEDCYDDAFCTCASCGDVVQRDDAVERNGEWYCEDCAPSSDTIHAYHCYSTDWHRHGVDPLLHNYELKFPLIGWELEIDGGGEDGDNAREITAAMGFEVPESDMLKCSHDGSLNAGFEIISQPCTLEYHLGRSRFR